MNQQQRRYFVQRVQDIARIKRSKVDLYNPDTYGGRKRLQREQPKNPIEDMSAKALIAGVKSGKVILRAGAKNSNYIHDTFTTAAYEKALKEFTEKEEKRRKEAEARIAAINKAAQEAMDAGMLGDAGEAVRILSELEKL